MNRADILDAAAQIISQKGFHAASMQDIAEAVHLQKASLYHHVSSKQEILFDLLDQTLDLLHKRISAVFSQEAPVEEKLRQGMRVYLTTLTEHADLAVVLVLEHRSLEEEYRARHIARRDQFEHLWHDLLQEGMRDGVFVETNPGLAAKALLGIMNWTITWYRADGPLPIEAISDQFAALFLNGLQVR